MGLFDYVKCEMPLPGLNEEIELQTKAFDDPYMEDYIITKEGRLLHQTITYEAVPLEERPYYKPGMDPNSLTALGGSFKRVPAGDVDLNFHGYLFFYGQDSAGKWHDFHARFTDGVCVEIKREEVGN